MRWPAAEVWDPPQTVHFSSLPSAEGWPSQVALVVKNPPTNTGDTGDKGDVGSIPGPEGPLEKEMASHCSVLAWRIPWTEEPGGLQSMGL